MTEEQFTDELQRLITRARLAETIPLVDLVGLIEAETEGLNMAECEGEKW